MKTQYNKCVIPNKMYLVKYKSGSGYIYGIGRLNEDPEYDFIDIIIFTGGVTIQDKLNVIFIKQY